MRRIAAMAALLSGGLALGQSVNVDLNMSAGAGSGVPSATFGGAAGSPGTWNSITSASPQSSALVDVNGNAIPATLTRSRTVGFTQFNNVVTTGDFDKLMDDYQESTAGGSLTYTFSGLTTGRYAVYVYTVYPDPIVALPSIVNVTNSGSQSNQSVGSFLTTNNFYPKSTNSVHVVDVSGPGNIVITVTPSNAGGACYVNGLQVKKLGTPKLRLYVNDNAAGTGDGGSWTNAFTSPQTALATARLSGGTNTEVWVANGFYKPSTIGDRNASFAIPNHLAFYGGFSGTETSVDQRGVFLTYLDGNIGNTGTRTDNSYVVVTADLTAADTIIDGFNIFNGYNDDNGTTDGGHGGGLRLQGGQATVRNCMFSHNYTIDYGGAIYVDFGGPIISNCTFFDNEAFRGSAVYHSDVFLLSMYNCNILGNSGFDGTIYFDNSDGLISGCFIHGNYGGGSGGAIHCYNTGSLVQISNCTIVGNSAGQVAGGIYARNGADVTIENSILWDNQDQFSASTIDKQYLGGSGSLFTLAANTIQGTAGSSGLNPLFVNAKGADNTYGTFDDNCNLQANSPCVDTGGNANLVSDDADLDQDNNRIEQVPLDLNDDPRIRNTVVDKGAFEYQPPCSLTADLNGDAVVNLTDLASLLAHFGTPSGATKAQGDVDGDHDVDLTDLSTLLSQFGSSCP